jgi:hypothetical protein
LNASLLCKWWWLLDSETGLWQEIVNLKYVKDTHVCLIQNKLSDSPVWSDLLKIKHIYLKGRGYQLNNGKLMSFWKDTWLGDKPICVDYPILFDLCDDQNVSVRNVAQAGWVIRFKVRLPPMIRDQWYSLAQKLNDVSFNGDQDKVVWKWSASRKFTVKSVYNHLTKNGNGPAYRNIWKAKLPEKIRIFVWLLAQGVVLTKDNMLKKNWARDPGCYFCGSLETNDHLFFQCPIAKVVWGYLPYAFNNETYLCHIMVFFPWIEKVLPGDRTSLFLALLLFGGQYGKQGTKLALRKNHSGTLVRYFTQFVSS